MRNRYRVLAEKYELVQESTTDTLPGEQICREFVLKCANAGSVEEVLNLTKEFKDTWDRTYPDKVVNPTALYIITKDIDSEMFGTGYFIDLYNALYYAILSLNTQQTIDEIKKKGGKEHQLPHLEYSLVRYLKNVKRAWDKWYKVMKPYKKAQKSIAQKSKETGINLDI